MLLSVVARPGSILIKRTQGFTFLHDPLNPYVLTTDEKLDLTQVWICIFLSKSL